MHHMLTTAELGFLGWRRRNRKLKGLQVERVIYASKLICTV